jgi:ATP-dependent Lhr-like helicase
LEPADEGEQAPHGGLSAVAEDVAIRFRGETNLLFCNSRRHTEILADQLRQIGIKEQWARDPFVLHHGSISKELREDAERDLKAGVPLTAICTSSLEMGIDIGSVRAVGQVGPTYQVSSLVQRLGRSGRKEGQPQILRLYTLDSEIDKNSSLTDRLFPELVRAIATVELMLEKWLEPPSHQRLHLSTCVHQILSLLRQSGGTHVVRLHDVLCKRGAFRRISPESFKVLLRSLAGHELISQMPRGELILAPTGERIVESREFYAAFASSIEYRVEHNSQTIGVLPKTSLPVAGDHLI